ncbi:MAG: rhodanese-like domain-containing protein [Sulfuritalea sp.]|jgi:rhodanese-related sulfurtransferase|nr:rhodanese-like domain-containing protein [Sulfuritalea sp.]
MNLPGLKTARIVALYCGLFAAGSAEAVVIDIDNGELARLVAAGVPLIDIRTAPEWQQTGIVPGSRLLTFFDERGSADPGSWLEKARTIAKPGDPVIVICRTGNRTKAVSQFLSNQAGYAKVYNVTNGITAWARDGRAIQPLGQHMASCRTSNTC